MNCSAYILHIHGSDMCHECAQGEETVDSDVIWLGHIEPTYGKDAEVSQCSRPGFKAERATVFSRIVRTCFQTLKSSLGVHNCR